MSSPLQRYYGESYPPEVFAPVITGGPGDFHYAVVPGDTFTTKPQQIDASDAANAAKLGPLGFEAGAGGPAWTSGQQFTVDGFAFNWTGAAWAPGAAAADEQIDEDDEEAPTT